MGTSDDEMVEAFDRVKAAICQGLEPAQSDWGVVWEWVARVAYVEARRLGEGEHNANDCSQDVTLKVLRAIRACSCNIRTDGGATEAPGKPSPGATGGG